jgi:hypothetical protein
MAIMTMILCLLNWGHVFCCEVLGFIFSFLARLMRSNMETNNKIR